MITRKNFLKASAGTAMAYSALSQLSAESGHAGHIPPLPEKTAEAIHSAASCKATGSICQAHCIELLGMGDKSLYECMKTVSEMMVLCESYIIHASQKSKLTKKVESVCIAACEACKKECLKHAAHHKQCKDCADACSECIQKIKAA